MKSELATAMSNALCNISVKLPSPLERACPDFSGSWG